MEFLSTQHLLNFYERVGPILAAWVEKPSWAPHEAAALCAGFIPPAPAEDGVVPLPSYPIDPEKLLVADLGLYRGYLSNLRNAASAPPREIMRSMSLIAPIYDADNEYFLEVRELFGRHSLAKYRWVCIIGNAVGLPLPALVPFSLLDAFKRRLDEKHANGSRLSAAQDGMPAEIVGSGTGFVVASASGTPSNERRRTSRVRERPSVSPMDRGYYTTEEVSGLTRLARETLTKYARLGTAVEGFVPFKPQNRRAWHWRDEQQTRESDVIPDGRM